MIIVFDVRQNDIEWEVFHTETDPPNAVPAARYPDFKKKYPKLTKTRAKQCAALLNEKCQDFDLNNEEEKLKLRDIVYGVEYQSMFYGIRNEVFQERKNDE